jgi:hypothetical protein
VPLGAGAAFELYKKFLQLLTFQMCADCAREDAVTGWSWMLKCPFHLPYLSELFAAFPDATVVWTHRNPVECVASACSLYETLIEMGGYGDTIDRAALGRQVLEYTELSLRKAQESLQRIGLGFTSGDSTPGATPGATTGVRVIHVRYEDNIKQSKKVCKDIVEQVIIPSHIVYTRITKSLLQKAGLKYTSEYDALLTAYLKKNADAREKLKSNSSIASKSSKADTLHEYSLADYGLSEELIRKKFAVYIKSFSL